MSSVPSPSYLRRHGLLYSQRLPSSRSVPTQHMLRILVAPSGFKESLGPDEVADCIEAGIRRVLPPASALVRKIPLHDGGEGFCRALVAAKGGELHELTVQGPVREPVRSHFGIISGQTGVLDMAAAGGLSLVPKDSRDPTVTTTFGVGELVAACLDAGCTKLIIGCGDSGTSDGGAGMLQALGARLFDRNGRELPMAGGGGSLSNLGSIDMSNVHPTLRNQDDRVQIEAVCNVKNVLCGARGVARIYGPQKGATPEQVETLSLALEKLSLAVGDIIHEDVGRKPGSGASGGLGTGLMLIGAQLRPRTEAADDYFGLGTVFNEPWDFVITGEGSLDSQSAQGKMTVEVARRATSHGAKVIALAGTVGHGADSLYDTGITSFTSILDSPTSLEQAMRHTDKLLKDAAERCIRMVQIGMALTFEEVNRRPVLTGGKAVVVRQQHDVVPSILKVATSITS